MSAVRTVGIHPAAELERRPALFAALSEAFPAVRFEGREQASVGGLDALIEFGGAGMAEQAAGEGVRALGLLADEEPRGPAREAILADTDDLDHRLRGQVLPDRHLGRCEGLTGTAGAEVVATLAGRPVWARRERLDVTALAPLELESEEPLRARLGRERSLALLPLIELLRAVTAADRWQPPALRAAFLLDDPNLHWPSYGFLNLPRLSRHAAEHGYHLALAMVPLDGWLAHPGATRLLRGRRELSLLVHGNDHFGGELGNLEGVTEAIALASQAQRRATAFERRTGIPVSRVMVPPHEACSEVAAAAMARTGFEAVTMTRPFPWLSPEPVEWLRGPAGSGALTGWQPADVAAGLPVMLRHPLANLHFSPAELALRAYLDQALILYGHHDDLAGGLDVLAERATSVNALGPARWGSLGELAAANFEQRREGELLRLRPFSRRLSVGIPEGVTEVVVEPPAGFEPGQRIDLGDGDHLPTDEPFQVVGSCPLELSLVTPDALSPAAVAAPPRSPRPLVRRLAGEARDRAAPLRGRLASRRSSA